MRICVLGSGSGGNSTLIEAGRTRILVDAGFSCRDLVRRLDQIGVAVESLDGIVVTHDHGDHTRGVGIVARRHQVPIYLTNLTRRACQKLFRGGEDLRPYQAGRPFRLGQLQLEPFITVHDAVDPVAIAVVDQVTGTRMGVATDLGRPTAQVRHALASCDFLVLEANHDEVMLREAPYPWSVKGRIASSHGHLSNHAAARLACDLLHPRLAGVVLAHLSNESNRPELARKVVGTALARAGYRGFLEVARQEDPTEFIDVERLRSRVGPEQLSFL